MISLASLYVKVCLLPHCRPCFHPVTMGALILMAGLSFMLHTLIINRIHVGEDTPLPPYLLVFLYHYWRTLSWIQLHHIGNGSHRAHICNICRRISKYWPCTNAARR
ncbi:hypothetical protein BDR05DRAFT_1041872 [Suillus weaverae]|nr:hypothetical protein BDR05DRAFT_1041872 [Suillus weaverae]